MNRFTLAVTLTVLGGPCPRRSRRPTSWCSKAAAPTYPAGKMIGAATPIKLAAGEFVVVVTEDARVVRIVGRTTAPRQARRRRRARSGRPSIGS